ncbi:unnamed protein product [Linum tenue]|uniref:Protein FAM33A n=1 Tax=Linum tenue TaxID=586396 RepID=A0AAV0LWR9_9ROSI|nr:unnamed protein product [Linum tenue]
MGRDHHRNQSTDGLVILLMKAHHDLAAVQFKLEKEFQQTYPENANPVKLVNRIKKMQEEVSGLKEQCRELLAAKQELVDKARSIMLGNNNVIQRMQVSTGISPTTVDDPAFADFNQMVAYFPNGASCVCAICQQATYIEQSLRLYTNYKYPGR